MSDLVPFHVPVLTDAVCAMMINTPQGIYLDGTLGGGGHFDALGRTLASGATLIGIDRDPEAVKYNRQREHDTNARIIIEQCRFSEASTILARYGITTVDGVLLDLGISSFQIDNEHRGFSFMRECDLDMRMNPGEGRTAWELISHLTDEELAGILEQYGEVRNAARMARAIKRFGKPVRTSSDLKECLSREYGGDMKYKILAKVFMALRIAVNDELHELQQVLHTAVRMVSVGGRIVIITYHSLEDRIVKDYFRLYEPHCICPEEALMCTCGLPGELKRITKKPITASPREIAGNPRSRSARLRVAEKL